MLRHVVFLVMLFVVFNAVMINAYAEFTAPSKTSAKTETMAKIPSTIQQWQSSSDPALFAQENNLTYSDGKISVYIYLDSAESVSLLPQTIEITSSADNIAVAFLDSRQITQVSQLDFVQRIDLPVITKPPPIPNTNDEIPNRETPASYDLYYAIIPAVVAIAVIIYVLKQKFKVAKL